MFFGCEENSDDEIQDELFLNKFFKGKLMKSYNSKKISIIIQQ